MYGTRASYSEIACDIFFSFIFQSNRPTQYQETRSMLNEKKGDGLMDQDQD